MASILSSGTKANPDANLFKNSSKLKDQTTNSSASKIAEQVEGAQKYLMGGDRVLIHEGEVSEFSFDTMKTSKLLHFYLFNDCILIAQKKRKMAYSSKFKLTAETCLSLAEFTVGDIKDDEGKPALYHVSQLHIDLLIWPCKECKNLFKIRTPSETFAYQADSPESKSTWIKVINDAIFELKNSRNNEQDQNNTKKQVNPY